VLESFFISLERNVRDSPFSTSSSVATEKQLAGKCLTSHLRQMMIEVYRLSNSKEQNIWRIAEVRSVVLLFNTATVKHADLARPRTTFILSAVNEMLNPPAWTLLSQEGFQLVSGSQPAATGARTLPIRCPTNLQWLGTGRPDDPPMRMNCKIISG
jgi:hypothetical protein